MRILSVSDHVESALYDDFQPQQFPGIDLILSCGDLPPEYLSFLMQRFDVPLFYVRGNHDIRYENTPPTGCIDIHRRLIRHRGIRLIGFEGSRWYNGGPNQYTENQMKGMIRRLWLESWFKKSIDIIITHAPPRLLGDAEDRCHRGFKSFHKLIRRYAPSFFIHGHIHANFAHPSQRITRVNHTKVVNTYGYFIFEID